MYQSAIHTALHCVIAPVAPPDSITDDAAAQTSVCERYKASEQRGVDHSRRGGGRRRNLDAERLTPTESAPNTIGIQMIQALLEALTTLGPMVFLMLSPIMIPLAVETVGFIADRRKMLTHSASVESKPTALASHDRELTQAQLTKAA